MTATHKPVDPVLKQVFMWLALRTMAEMVGGVNPDDQDAVITWCHNVGFILPAPTRGQVGLTPKGGQAVWLFSKLVQEGIEASVAAKRAHKKHGTEGAAS